MANLRHTNNLTALLAANTSFDVALIPTSPLKDQLSAASLEIARHFPNNNIIDNEKFPAHLSFYLGGTDNEFVGLLKSRVEASVDEFMSVTFLAEKLFC